MRLEILEAAGRAIVEQAEYYQQKSGADLAMRWETAVDDTIRNLLRFPHLGPSVRFRSERLTGLRWLRIPGFPRHLIFYRYLLESETLQVVHVLHGARDLPALLDEAR